MTVRARVPAHLLIAVLVSSLAQGRAMAAVPVRLVPSTEVVLKAGRGAKVSVLYVGLDPKAKSQGGIWERAAEAAVTAGPKLTWVPPADASSPTAAKAREQRLQDAQDAIAAGQKSLDDLDNAKASEHFAEAIAAAKEADITASWPVMIDAITRKAGNHATAGESAPAKQELERLLGVNVKAELNPAMFPPDLIKFAETVRKANQQAKGELTIRSEPPGANVWVDGTFRGQAPVTVGSMTNVRHFVSVTLGGYTPSMVELIPAEELVRLKPAEQSTLWRKTQDAIEKAGETASRDAAAKALAKALKLDQLILIVAKKSSTGDKLDLTALRLETRDGHNVGYKTGTVLLNDGPGAASFLSSIVDKDTPRKGTQPVTHFSGGDAADPKLVAGLALLGVGVVAAGVGTTCGIVANSRQERFKTFEQNSKAAADFRADGKTYALIADVSFVTAIVTGIAGGALALSSLPPAAPPDDEEPAPKPEKTKAKTSKRLTPDSTKPADEEASTKKSDEADRRKREDEERKRDEADRKKRDEEDKKRDEADRKRRDEEDKKRDEADRKKRDEEDKKRAEEDKKRDEADRKKREDEEKKQAEADKKRAEEDKKREEADRKKREEEDKKRAEAERLEAAAKNRKLTPAERKKLEDDQRRAEEEKKAREEEEERQRIADERKKREEARKKKEEEEKKRLDEDLRNH